MRRRRAPKREILPDPKYNNLLIAKMVNILMVCGKKSTAERLVYQALDHIKEKTQKDPLDVFKQALENARPLLETKSRRVGGATYQVPVSVRPDRGATLAIRWIRDFARGRRGSPMDQKLSQEILDAYNKTGSVMKKREDSHKMAESNRAFAHYRW
ncbi:MAG: 30S ribosomal protein S7 [Omnitrophica bacterium RIFCSPLOWO2_12_FULL_44_17]|uniref:Small ribosomal subunit protein uS7 n=1 Tax=Candidatus Danuiimicrobium aquiferis TaxID=1801832 RepID=A0A1G1KU14_9BACT|nr:MAG: 30S ribosomal protein S7 [Omnitrophica bacterium RIFCSPHIGHO2_02_FULL_45_28]OGW96421.1 MAG: 30S ribosomal protein S7 [Omnitrophica bacterium RIFCSPLOWO2_12_FULL_44_17]OGX01986.1 MAG: 30S ribosomal protein S7 [Omnitrophica bacterium RIFCSPLOWO2_02_FULL_44_11]